MAHAVRTLLAAGAGPQRMRGELRLRTARLHALRRGRAAVASVGAQVPSTLLDGGLAPVLSERLRTLLLTAREEPSPDVAAPPLQRALARDGAAAAAAGQTALAPASGVAAAVRRLMPEPAAPTAARRRRVEPATPRAGQKDPGQAEEFASSPGGAGSAPVPAHAAAAARPLPERAAPMPDRPVSSAGQAESLLESRLREYWRLHTAAPAAHAAAPTPPAAPRTARAAAAPPAVGLTPSPNGAGWPERAGREAARRVFGPAGTALSAAPVSLADMGATAPLAQPVQMRNEFHITVGAHEDDDALADRIAELLREQALRHGIDLT
jgi:hypothetical protein